MRIFIAAIALCWATQCCFAQSGQTAKDYTPTPLPVDADTQRKLDVNALKLALEAYAKKNAGSYMVKGSGALGNGTGFVQESANGIPSIATALTNAKLLKRTLSDTPSSPNYMLHLCDNGRRYAISAMLDRPSTAELDATMKTCNAQGDDGAVTKHKRNYAVGN